MLTPLAIGSWLGVWLMSLAGVQLVHSTWIYLTVVTGLAFLSQTIRRLIR